MCNLILPVRICTKCGRKDAIVSERLFREKDKQWGWRASREVDHEALSLELEQDCYSRWCVYSSDHPEHCMCCSLTCKQWRGKIRELHGGSSSYICSACTDPPDEAGIQPSEPPFPKPQMRQHWHGLSIHDTISCAFLHTIAYSKATMGLKRHSYAA